MRRFLPAFAAALACAACAVPVFDPGISASVALFRASHVVGSTPPSIGPDRDANGEPDLELARNVFTFMPVRMAGTLDLSQGFVIQRWEYDNWNRVLFQWFDGDTVRWLDSPAGYNEEEGLRWRWPVTLKNGTSLGAIMFEGGDFETYVERLWANTGGETCEWNPAYHSFNLTDVIKADLLLGTPPIVVGMSVNALDLPGQDRLHVLVREGSLYSEAEVLVSDPGITGAFTDAITPHAYPLPELGTPRHLNYARDALMTRSFAQWPDGDAWRTWAWKGTIGTGPLETDEVVGIDRRIDAVLTVDPIWGWTFGSYLLSTERQVGRVYRYDGIGTEALVAEFPLGTLRFIGEMYLDGEWQLLFSRSLVENDRLRFEIRGIFTKDLLDAFGR